MVPERRLQETSVEESRPRPHARPRPRLTTFYARLSITVVIAILAVSRFAAAAQVGYAIDRTQAQLQLAQAQELTLEGQLSALSSAGRLVGIASKLKLAPAPPVLSITVPPAETAAVASRGTRRTSGVRAAITGLIRSITRAVVGM